MKNTIKLALTGCLALSTLAVGQTTMPSARDTLPDSNTIPRTAADRASGRDPSGQNAAGAQAGERTQQDQLAAIAKQPETAGDKLFVLDAAMGNQWEIAQSRIVLERATDEEVKWAAQHLIDDHTAAQAKLKVVADKMDLTLPAGLPQAKLQKLQVYRAMSVDQLEKCFVVSAKAAHAKDISCYADHAKLTQNADLKGYINETLPRLQHHAQQIQTAAAAKGLTSDVAGSGQPKVGGQMPTGRTE